MVYILSRDQCEQREQSPPAQPLQPAAELAVTFPEPSREVKAKLEISFLSLLLSQCGQTHCSALDRTSNSHFFLHCAHSNS